MIKEIHWFDLDYTLWNTNSKWWIIDKMNPKNFILKISQYEGQLILNGNYIEDNNKITYNGLTGWISNELITEIKQKKDIDLKNIGLSFREYVDPKLIQKQSENLFIYIDRLQDIKTKSINVLTARPNKEAHKELLNDLTNNLKKINININEAIFVNDLNNKKLSGSTPERKLQILIQSLIGYEIKNNSFNSMMCDSCDICYFYDDEDKNIDQCKFINDKINLLLTKTQPWLKQRIEENLKFNKKKLITNLVTSNEMNPFITEIIEIKLN